MSEKSVNELIEDIAKLGDVTEGHVIKTMLHAVPDEPVLIDPADKTDWAGLHKNVKELYTQTLSPTRRKIVDALALAVMKQDAKELEIQIENLKTDCEPVTAPVPSDPWFYQMKPVGNPHPSYLMNLLPRMRSNIGDSALKIPEDPGEATLVLDKLIAGHMPVSCVGCGKCCRAVHGGQALRVMLRAEDKVPEAMIDREFKPYRASDTGALKMRENGDCQAFEVETKTCGIYEQRPSSCRVYPRGCSQCRWVVQPNPEVSWWAFTDLENLFWCTVHPLELRELIVYGDIIPPYVVDEAETAELKRFILNLPLADYNNVTDVMKEWTDMRSEKLRKERDAQRREEPQGTQCDVS